MFRETARAVTGVDGRYLVAGWDRGDIRPQLAGETITVWEREVTYKGATRLKDILVGKSYPSFHLFASILVRDEKIPSSTEVEVLASGAVKEIRVGKKQYRMQGSKYYGKG